MRSKKIKCTLTSNIFKLLSRPALSSSKEEHRQIRQHQENRSTFSHHDQVLVNLVPKVSRLTASLGWARSEMRDPGNKVDHKQSWILVTNQSQSVIKTTSVLILIQNHSVASTMSILLQINTRREKIKAEFPDSVASSVYMPYRPHSRSDV